MTHATRINAHRPRARIAAALVAAVALMGAGSARADVYASYSVTLDAGVPDVTDIIIFETFPPFGSSTTWAFQAAGGSTTVIGNPFPRPNPPAQSLLVGIVNGLAGDGDSPVDHAVLFLNSGVAQTILDQGLSFASLFPGTSESDLITAIEGIARFSTDSPESQAGFTFMNGFLPSVHALPIPDGMGGTNPVDGFVSDPGDFTAIAFSDPTRLGSGTATLIGNPVPEPSTTILLGVGLGLLGLRHGRRPSAARES